MAMESVINTVVGKLMDYLFMGASRQLGYVFHYNHNVRTLRKQADKLKGARERVQGRIDEAERKGEIIEADVQKWVADADAVTLEADTFLEDEANSSKTCAMGLCINLRTRYRFSKDAKKKTPAIAELQQDVNRLESSVSRPAPPLGIEAFPSINVDPFKSQRSVSEKVIEALNNPEIQIIGVCGMGGVGKTTLVTELGKRMKESKLFDEVAMTVVSQTVNVTNIQSNIANMLGAKVEGNDDSERARSLWARLSDKKRILVILDDVWSRLDLSAVGIPFGKDHMNCKIILTSRSNDVCNAMDAQAIFSVGELSKEEAWVLFRETAGGEALDTDDLNPIARVVANECGGLPIAILVVGRALRNKSKVVWMDAAEQLKNSNPTNIGGVQGDVFRRLELSYNYLESKEAKSCFLLCCLFPEDSKITVENLARYGLGLRLFQDGFSLKVARGRAHTAVSTLKASFLLLSSEYEEYVKMHDVVRDVAISIASKEHNTYLVKAGIGLREWPEGDSFEDYTTISLMENHIRELPVGLKCPNIRTLLLQNNSPMKVPNNFFQGMTQLRVLDMAHCKLDSVPQSLALLTSLRTLHLDISNDDRTDITLLRGLRELEIFCISGRKILELPEKFGEFTNLRLLDVKDCAVAEIAPGVITNLRKLEHLSIGDSFTDWEVVEEGRPRNRASLTELNSLSGLVNLEIVIPNVNMIPEDLQLQDLLRSHNTIGATIDYSRGEGIGERNCVYDSRETTFTLSSWIKKVLEAADYIGFAGLKNWNDIISDMNTEGLNSLKTLNLEHNNSVSCLLDTHKWATRPALCRLERLYIYQFTKLSQISHGQPAAGSFGQLRSIVLQKCSKMLTVVPSSLLMLLPNLENVKVVQCNSLAYVFESEGLLLGDEEVNKPLSRLKSIELMYLPMMTDIWKAPHQFINLSNLEHVTLLECDSLRRLFSPILVQQGLVHLRSLEIVSCSNMELVFGTLKEEAEAAAAMPTVNFPCLSRIYLKDMPNLESFCSGHCRVEYPSLESLSVVRCPKLENFGFGVQVTPKMKKVDREFEGNIQIESGVNAALQQIIQMDNRGQADLEFLSHSGILLETESGNLRFYSEL